MLLLAAASLAAATLALSWLLADGAAGWAYLLIYAAACAPGIPVGIAIFGHRHAAGWITGALLGYGLTQLTLWAVIAGRMASGGWHPA